MSNLHAPTSIKYKKNLLPDLQSGEKLFFADPSIINPKSFYSQTMRPGESFICTNHPKKSWFAKVERTEDGWKVS
jgi:hypothetical protein